MKTVSAALVCLVLLSGCNVGPKYKTPSAPTPPAFKESAPAAYKQMPPGTWEPAKPQDAVLKGKWWEIYNEPELNALEEKLDINNQNIKQFFENFMAARAQVGQARAAYYPTVTGSANVERSHGAASAIPCMNSNTLPR
jgi:outer membrane protein TolC